MGSRKSQGSSQKWICSQIGAREHYALARALNLDGRLGTLYTDFWAGPVIRKISKQTKKRKTSKKNSLPIKSLQALAARYHPDLEFKSQQRFQCSGISRSVRVCSWNWRALWWEKILRGEKKSEPKYSQNVAANKESNRYHGFIEVGKRFATCVRKDLSARGPLDLKSDLIFLGYDTGSLEVLEWCRERNIKSIVNQIDPNRVEIELVRAEEKQWPGWASEAIEVPEEYFLRREKEWRLADRVLVNSEFCRQALLKQGVPPSKLVVVPLCFETKVENKTLKSRNRIFKDQPLKVLFLGQVILRKGIQYLMSAARLLENENIRFDIVGPIGISAEAMASAPRNLTFHGRAGRDATSSWYQRSDIFVLPTLSDGFALTQLEAMAEGLPVIATHCCGEVVDDGTDGFIVPPRNAKSLANCLLRYLAQPELLQRHSEAALVKARQFTLPRLAENLTRVENDLNTTHGKSEPKSEPLIF